MRCYTVFAMILAAWPGSAADLFQAIRANDFKTVKRLVRDKESANAKNSNDATALMYAALHADVQCMKYLLDKGADLNAANTVGATALMWAAGDLAKVKLLVESGAKVDARSKEGRTAIHIAARQQGSTPIVRLLLERGADANDKDASDGTPLLLAAEAGDLDTVKLLVERGANVLHRARPDFGAPRFGNLAPDFVKAKPTGDFGGASALIMAVTEGHKEIARYLLSKGAKPNQTTVGNFTPLMASVQLEDPEIARLLIGAGADVNARDSSNATPLILAAASDETTPAIIQLLRERGADVNVKDARGRTALDWAVTRGDSPVARALGATISPAVKPAPAAESKVDTAAVRQSVDRSIDLLLKSSGEFFRQSGCISCHHQSLAQMAIAVARKRGFTVNEDAARYQNKATLSVFSPHREPLLQAVPTVPASAFVSTFGLIGLAAEGQPASDITDAMVHELAARQRGDGSWYVESSRPPLDQGVVSSTALSVRSLQLYMLPGRKQEFEQRIAKARAWLSGAPASTTQEKAMRLLGLAWSKADRSTISEAARDLLSQQRASGGWAQLPTLEPDAYATGQSLAALYEADALKPSTPAYQRGAAFLLSTQKADGSWHVKSRALGFQPYFESGYPHGHDQWISAAGGAWATMALALTAEPSADKRRLHTRADAR